MKENYEANIIPDEENFDPFASGFEALKELAVFSWFSTDDEELDPEAFILAVGAFLCLDKLCDSEERESILFNDISPIIHPDKATADYAVHWARRCISDNAIIYNDDDTGRKTIYEDIAKAMENIVREYSEIKDEFHNYFPNRILRDSLEQEVSSFMTEERLCNYYNDPFFALSVCLYTSYRCHTSKKEAVSLMYQKLTVLGIGGRECCNIINDVILLVDNCFKEPLLKMFSPMMTIWLVIRGLALYFGSMSDGEWEFICGYYNDDEKDE